MGSVIRRLLPREESFFSKFVEMSENIHAGAAAMVALLENYTNVGVQAEVIKGLEHKGDTMTHSLMTKLNQTFITPLDREDIHELSSKIDDVLDLVDAVASRLVTYRVDRIRPGVAELAKILMQSTEEIVKAVKVLERPDHILEHCIEINRLENEGDRLSRALIAQLFVEEKDPVQIIKWKEIIETLETAIDKCEDVANVIESVVIKSSG
jgi:predicted phosphate transport protein (TIGR00153 family)